ncbi:hypothetical protein P186_1847 [Pyrobaculum ferrireducens]|uniref:Uncharacterized protein n=1 Tax=Pyrobaculum ferrireducens TaxID=1104324 RepID=G7VHG0_9CREN|nr:hypothetical protein P186_1847 [Pyrobaculum ferrireducens]
MSKIVKMPNRLTKREDSIPTAATCRYCTHRGGAGRSFLLSP